MTSTLTLKNGRRTQAIHQRNKELSHWPFTRNSTFLTTQQHSQYDSLKQVDLAKYFTPYNPSKYISDEQYRKLDQTVSELKNKVSLQELRSGQKISSSQIHWIFKH